MSGTRGWAGTRTPRHVITSRGQRAIDTGFISSNDRTYPKLVRLFRELGVSGKGRGFGVSDPQSGLGDPCCGLAGFFAAAKNILRPADYRLFPDSWAQP